jgi:diguanylate cyclase (GGDEF)-like protein
VASGPDLALEAVLSSVGLVALHLLFTWFALSLARRDRDHARLRRSWLLLALSGVAGAAAEAMWLYLESVLHVSPRFSAADVFFYLHAGSGLAGVLSLPFAPRSPRERALFALDMSIVLTAGLMVLWWSILAPLQRQPVSPLLAAYVIGYVTLGLMIVAAVTALVQSEVARVSRSGLWLLSAGMLIAVGADVFSGYALLFEVDFHSPYLNLAWVLAQALLALALAWEAGRTALDETQPAAPRSRVVLPYAAVIFGLALLALELESGRYDVGARGLLLAAALLVGLVLGRQLLVLRDNTRLYEQAQRAAVTDPLTGLYNRLFIDRAVRTEVERAGRYGQELSLLIVDVDGFKLINDRHGHARGDGALVSIAAVLRSQCRATDICGRFGGDEFVVLLPQTTSEGAREAAARMSDAVRRIPFEAGPLRVSIGVGSLAAGMGAEELFERADREMYARKSRAALRPAAGGD